MDESLRDLVSRYTDGDLDDAESSRLEARSETDPDLAAEIETTRKLRAAVRAIADRMEPPAALDRVMEPLRQAPPVPVRQARPVFRWLGIAAALVLGVTVATEMARRNPTPTLSPASPQQNRPIAERDEIFKLAPLPTAVPNDNRPLGAADHLLEEEPALPAAPEPAPLEVMGPLDDAAPSTSNTESISSAGVRSADGDGDLELWQGKTSRPAPAKRETISRVDSSSEPGTEAEFKRQEIPTDGGRESTAEPSTVGKLSRGQAKGKPQGMVASVLLLIDDTVVWTGSSTNCQNGRWPVRIELEGKVVSAIAPVVDEGEDKEAVSCIPDAFIGSGLEGVGNGIHLGELLVGEPLK